nr:hypothetical protein [Streptomyces luteolifulvus]
MSYDLTWTAGSPALGEPHHLQRRGARLTAAEWTGTRDRSWGVRPLPGEEGGRFVEEHPTEGFHWIWCPVRFEDRFLMVITQEGADGHRSLNIEHGSFGRHDPSGFTGFDSVAP